MSAGLAGRDARRENRRMDASGSPRRRTLRAILVAVIVLVVVYLAAAFLGEWIVSARYPAPDQAATWAMIVRFVAATLAVAFATQAWYRLRRR